MLTIENISVNYGAIEALTDISMRVEQGEVVTLTLFQRDHLRECKLKVAHAPVPAYLIVKNSEPTTLQRDIYKGWLGAPLDTGTGSR